MTPRAPFGGASALRLTLLLGTGVLTAACTDAGESPTGLASRGSPRLTESATQVVFASGAHVQAWDPIFPAVPYADWTKPCTTTPAVGPDAAWANPHPAYEVGRHSWEGLPQAAFDAKWINAWDNINSVGDRGQSWTRYSTPVSGVGTFVVQFLADNCSWIYLDNQLVGHQDHNWLTNGGGKYPVTLSGNHVLTFIIWDGGVIAGGKFRLETVRSYLDNGGSPLLVDKDRDGVTDDVDAFPTDPRESKDTDGDGMGDNSDPYPLDATNRPDSDGDGVQDIHDAFPADPDETADRDGDGVGDNGDRFPSDPKESRDSDGEGVGDVGDAFPNDASETKDSDGDGVGDSADAFPFNKSETKDSDRDGVGDNSDAFPNDPAETLDSDRDGVGNNADAFPADPAESKDSDRDGIGDNADRYPSSNRLATVVIGGVDSGVANRQLGGGATMNDLIGACVAGGRNKGQAQSCVGELATEWSRSGLISSRESAQIKSAAARA